MIQSGSRDSSLNNLGINFCITDPGAAQPEGCATTTQILSDLIKISDIFQLLGQVTMVESLQLLNDAIGK